MSYVVDLIKTGELNDLEVLVLCAKNGMLSFEAVKFLRETMITKLERMSEITGDQEMLDALIELREMLDTIIELQKHKVTNAKPAVTVNVVPNKSDIINRV